MRRLLKYEMRAMNRRLFPLYIGLIAAAVLNLFFGAGTFFFNHPLQLIESLPGANHQFLQFVSDLMRFSLAAALFALIIAVFVVWIIAVIDRFGKGLLGEEGYLMFTLPLPVSRLVGAKLIAAAIHSLLAALSVFAAILILITPLLPEMLRSADFAMMFRWLREYLPTWPILLVEFALSAPIGALVSVLQFYLAMSIGQLFNRHRTACAIIAFFVITAVIENISGILGFAIPLLGDMDAVQNFIMAHPAVLAHGFGVITLVSSLILAAAFWFPTLYILKRHLNLE